MPLKLTEILVYPVKSLAGISLQNSEVKSLGLIDDRCLMLVDKNGLFISQRKFPQLALLTVRAVAGQLVIVAAGKVELVIDHTSFSHSKINVRVWNDDCDSFVANNTINDWFSQLLDKQVYLVKYDFDFPRKSDPHYSKSGDIVSFADGFPLLLISNASLFDLNSKLEEAVSMTNFRPNLVIEGCSEYEEELWEKIRIGENEFDLVKKCSRCVLTTIDPKTGTKSSSGEPLKTLSSYRETADGVMFGMNLIPRNSGRISVGDRIEVIC